MKGVIFHPSHFRPMRTHTHTYSLTSATTCPAWQLSLNF